MFEAEKLPGVGGVGGVGEDRDDRGARIGRAEVGADRGQAARIVGPVGDGQAEVDRVEQGLLIHLREDHAAPGPARSVVDRVGVLRILVAGVDDVPVDAAHVARWEGVVGVVIVVERDADLLQVIRAIDPPCRLAGGLHGGQEQGDQDRDDGDHHQELDQREAAQHPLGARNGHRDISAFAGRSLAPRPTDATRVGARLVSGKGMNHARHA